jgi:type 1 fimbriae regulatory protein FimB
MRRPGEIRDQKKRTTTPVVVAGSEKLRRASGPKMAVLTREEILAVLKVARQRRTRDWCMLLVAYLHGLRTMEVCGLKLTDLKNGSLAVQRRKGSLRTVQPLYSNAEPLLDETQALREWLAERPRGASDALFTSQKGGPLHRCQFFRIFQSIAKAARLSAGRRHPRVLKYSRASHLLDGNTGVAAVSEILGHRSLHSTLQYIKAAAWQRTEAAAAPVPKRLQSDSVALRNEADAYL